MSFNRMSRLYPAYCIECGEFAAWIEYGDPWEILCTHCEAEGDDA